MKILNLITAGQIELQQEELFFVMKTHCVKVNVNEFQALCFVHLILLYALLMLFVSIYIYKSCQLIIIFQHIKGKEKPSKTIRDTSNNDCINL